MDGIGNSLLVSVLKSCNLGLESRLRIFDTCCKLSVCCSCRFLKAISEGLGFLFGLLDAAKQLHDIGSLVDVDISIAVDRAVYSAGGFVDFGHVGLDSIDVVAHLLHLCAHFGRKVLRTCRKTDNDDNYKKTQNNLLHVFLLSEPRFRET